MAKRCMIYMHACISNQDCNLHTAAACSHVTMLSALEDEEYICLQGDRFIFILPHAGPANKDCMAEHSH